MSGNGKIALADLVGIKYGTFNSHINSARPVYSATFDQRVIIQDSSGVELSTAPVGRTYVTTAPITGFDLEKLGLGFIYAYLPDKLTLYDKFITPSIAAIALDNKYSSTYISRYINVEYLVKTCKGAFYQLCRS